MHRIAYFITSHGFGHAARSSAVMDAVNTIDPSVSFDIFTTVPRWFFEDSVSGHFTYHEFQTGVGLIQQTPFSHDLNQTIEKLDQLIPFDLSLIGDAANLLKRRACQLVVCDIAPIGISIATEAGIPSILIENFTWDWIYEGFIHSDVRIGRHVDFLREIYRMVDYHVQTPPVCNPQNVDMETGPISREVRMPDARVREKLDISPENKIVLLTMGGIKEEYRFLENLLTQGEICFVVSGGSERAERHNNLILLPHRSDFFHPDLVNCADVVVGKAGYSTIAEVYHAGVPFGYVPRANFRETAKLVAFIEKKIKGLCVGVEDFQAGKWLRQVSQLLALNQIQRQNSNGSHQVAAMIVDLLKRERN